MTSHGHGESHGGHAHGHSHGHGHGDGKDLEQPLLGKVEKTINADEIKLKRAVYFALFFMFVEIFGGIAASSLAIITDAAHMLSDVGGFIVSLLALQLSTQAATAEYTYGFKQAEPMGALLSIAIVWALTAVLLWEAFGRFMTLTEVDAPMMFVISVIGFFVNIVLMMVLGHGHGHGDGDDHGHGHGGHGHADHGSHGGHGGHDDHGGAEGDSGSVAVQAAVAHVIGDILQSLGVCMAAGLMWWQPFDVGVASTGVSRWNYADPLCTVLFGFLVLMTTKGTLKRTIAILMGKAPGNKQREMFQVLSAIEGVVQIHDLHVWSHGSSDLLCTAHIVVSSAEHSHTVLRQAVTESKKKGLGHTTFQIEVDGQFQCDVQCDAAFLGAAPRKDAGHGHDHGGHDAGHAVGHSGDCCGGHGHDDGPAHAGHDAGHAAGHAHDAGHSHGGGGHGH
ncbi:unnamed protein product [Prorocentrum cordatum]|uniref:Uncharacterized protein n=1 Tax=Prorocentrum cordatum TaxID=2364126 RepID=A0ABN9VKG7_9DINO|nr:unnamed protein product [Polarella glacialis]